MELFLLRHGQSQGNVLSIAGLDPPLTETGLRQIRRAGQRLAKTGITRLYCSSLFRAIQTAGIVREPFSVEPAIDPVFCEIWGDDWRGRTRSELAPDFPWANLPDRLEHRWWPAVAETANDVALRAERAMDTILRENTNEVDRVCLVGHILFGSALLRHILRIPIDFDAEFYLYNASITHVQFHSNGKRIVRSLNDVSHLPPDLWT